MTKDLKTDRWTCPNDRNLQLRSKLNAGWSCHTKKTLKKDTQLSESELIEIQKVLQRSEMLERNERSRVSRLVERLENMKRNASQSKTSPNCCALCGDFFSLVRSAQNQCGSCFKVLCSKCCIDTQYTIEDNSWSNASSSSISFLTRTTRRNSSFGSGQKSVIYLCRLCSEQREFLKKSGAWFLKKYPSYLTDTDKYNSTSNLSQLEKNHTSQSTASFNNSHSNTGSPSYLTKNNKSISPSDSLSFRFWKTGKDTISINNNFTNDNDTFSFISNETDLQQDLNSNNDSISVTTRTASSENFIFNKSSPVSVNKKQENFTFSSPLTRSGNSNNSAITTASALNNTTKTATFKSIKKTNRKLITSFSSDSNNEEEKTNNNMESYNYYSNILNNINPDSNKKDTNSVKNYTKNPIETITKNEKLNSFKMMSNDKTKAVSSERLDKVDTELETSSLKRTLSRKSNQDAQKCARNLCSITNGVINSSLSASASNLDYNPELGLVNSNEGSFKSLNSKKGKLTEWCSTQISMDNDNDGELFENKTLNGLKAAPNSTAKSKGINMSSILGYSSLSNNTTVSKVKLKPKSIKYGNMDKVGDNSIAASTSSAVASASSLATSLNNLNFD